MPFNPESHTPMERHALYSDSELHGAGNKLAHDLHSKRTDNTGVWVCIKPMQNHLEHGGFLTKLVKQYQGHAFRVRNNDLRVWLPEESLAYQFVRSYRTNRPKDQHVIGIGYSCDQAQQAQVLALASLGGEKVSVKALIKDKPEKWAKGDTHTTLHYEPQPHDFGLKLANPLKTAGTGSS
jgi:hypothetical protein